MLAKADLSERVELDPTDLISFDGVVRHVDAGEWSAKVSPSLWSAVERWMPLTPDLAAPLLAIVDGRTIIMCGPLTPPGATLAQSGTERTLTLSGVDDMGAFFGSRLTYPQPADSPPWTTDQYHVLTGLASTAVAALIAEDRGLSARAERQGTIVTVTDQSAGMDGTWQFRLGSLMDGVSQIAQEAGLAVTLTRQLSDNTVNVLVGQARNRTTLVLDDSKLGDFSISLSPATATTVIAGGAGEGTSRLFAIAGDEVAGDARVEMFSDQRNISSLPALQRSAEATRAANAATVSFAGQLSAEAADAYVWRRDYDLGDTIMLRVGTTAWPVTVQAVSVHWGDDGQRITPVLGTTPRHALEQLIRDVDGLSSRLDGLEVA